MKKGTHHTKKTIKKFTKTIRKQYENGRVPWIKGKHHTGKSKEKMSLAKIGRHISPKTEFKKGYIPKNKLPRKEIRCKYCNKIINIPISTKRIFCSMNCYSGAMKDKIHLHKSPMLGKYHTKESNELNRRTHLGKNTTKITKSKKNLSYKEN